jgi:hypothetical protein
MKPVPGKKDAGEEDKAAGQRHGGRVLNKEVMWYFCLLRSHGVELNKRLLRI